MIWYIFILVLLVIGNYKFYGHEFNESYLDKDSTMLINGIFITFVFLSHFIPYTLMNGIYDKPYLLFRNYMGQLIVAPFLFYSGYGMMYSINKKGNGYVKALPWNRIGKTLIHFDIAVLAYLTIKISYNKYPTIEHTLKSFVAYKSLGNSDWYIFAILTMWILTYLVFNYIPLSNYKRLGILLVLVLIEMYVLSIKKPTWWYDTMLCYIFGMYYCLIKERVEAFLQVNFKYVLTLSIMLGVFWISGQYKKTFWISEVWVLSFVILLLLLTMKFEFKSKVLMFLGAYLFEIYIFMRIPMMLLKPLFKGHNYWYLITCGVLTVVLAVVMHKFYHWLDKKLFNKKAVLLNENK